MYGGLKEEFMPEDQATQRLAEILNRISKLPSANLEPPQFFANFLQLTVAGTGSRGGAIWLIQPGQGPQCYCHVELELCQINEPGQQKLVVEAVQRVVKDVKSLVIPGAGVEPEGVSEGEVNNQCSYPLFFKPLKAANQVAMVVQMIGSESLNPHDFRAVVGLLEQIGESAETYLAHRRAAVLEDDRKALARLLKYAEGVHGTLESDKVIYKIANLGRDAIGCERVVVWIDPKVKRGLRAVSGVDKPDRRAVLLQSQEKLSKHCLVIKKPIIASRGQLAELPEEEELTDLLKDYFNVSQLNEIFLQPIKNDEDYLGVLIAEGFEEERSANLAGIMSSVSNHGAVALANALEMGSVPMLKPLGKLKKARKDPKTRRKWLIRLGVVLVGLVIFLMTPWTVKIECGCELTPKYKRVVESLLDNVQIVSIEKSGGKVQKDQIVAVLDVLDLETQLHTLQQKLKQEDIMLRTHSNETDRDISLLEIDKLNNQIDYLKEQIERCLVRAPINGTILTPQLEQKVGMTLRKGDPIFEMADRSSWQLKLDVPQEEIDWVQKGLEEGGKSQIQFFLTAYPKDKLEAELTENGQISQMARVKDEGNVYEIWIDLSQEQLSGLTHGLRVGMVGRAKILTVSRALGYVLLRKVIRFFRVTMF